MTANKQGLFAALIESPRDLWAWCNLRDVLEEEGEPDEVLRVADQAGTWIGSREDWEREGPLVVDRVPVSQVWVVDIAPRFCTDGWIYFAYEGRTEFNGDDPDDLPTGWAPEGDHYHCTLADAQAWLTQIALDYARRVRDKKKEEGNDE